jgi:hypothetical protein|tara:strand:+ start:385 stop:612 length:228 start_codon:yes stop_codon:yes gene_type:complete
MYELEGHLTLRTIQVTAHRTVQQKATFNMVAPIGAPDETQKYILDNLHLVPDSEWYNQEVDSYNPVNEWRDEKDV